MKTLFRIAAAMLPIALVPAAAFAAAPTARSAIDPASVTFTFTDTGVDDGAALGADTVWGMHRASACIRPEDVANCFQPGTPAQITGREGDATVSSFADGLEGHATAAPGALWASVAGTGATGSLGVNGSDHVGLVFRGDGRLTVEANYRLDVGGLDGLTWRETLAWAGIIVFPQVTPMIQVERLLVASGSGTSSDSGRLSISFDFTDGQFTEVLFHTHVHTLQPLVATPVPEPATAMLALAGLGLVGAATRKRPR